MPELARLLDPAELDAADGRHGRMRAELSVADLGRTVAIVAPRLLTCARCDGGGCDRCGRSGALRLDLDEAGRTTTVVLPREAGEHLRIRLAHPFGRDGGLDQLTIEIRLRPSKRVFDRHSALVVGALALVGAASTAKTLGELDLPWHLAIGRQIARTASIPSIDDFAYTHTAVRYVGAIADLVLYGVMHVGGSLGLQLVNGLVAIAIAMVLSLDVSARAPRAKTPSLVVVACATVAMSTWVSVRPATLGFLFAALTLLLVSMHRAAPGTPRGKRALVAAAPLALLWCNVHGSAPLGVAVLGAYAAYRAACTVAGGHFVAALPAADAGALGVATGTAAAAAALACVNPAGHRLFTAAEPVKLYADVLAEWQATTWHHLTAESPAAGAFLFTGVLVIALGRNADGSRRASLFDIGLVVGALLLATRIGFVPIAIIVLAPIAAVRVAGFVPDSAVTRRAAAALAFMAGPAILAVHPGTLGVGFDPRIFPEPATRFVVASGLRGNMWNYWPFGGYLIWRLYPEHRVLLDGRIGFVHEPELVRRVVASEVDPAAFAALAAEHHFEWAFCRAEPGIDACAAISHSRDWQRVFADSISAVYVRRDGLNRNLTSLDR